MPVKKRLAKRRTAHSIPRDLVPTARRVIELSTAHIAAIRGGDQSFYSDGRHEELVTLLPIIHQAMDIKPWEDSFAIVDAALAALEEEDARE